MIQKAKLGHSLFGKVFSKVLDESDKKEGLSKRLKNIKDKSEKQLKMIENKKKQSITHKFSDLCT